MRPKLLVCISIFAVMSSCALVFADDHDGGKRSDMYRQEMRKSEQDSRMSDWGNEKEWREYQKDRRRAYKSWRSADREEWRDFEKYLREREQEWREYLRDQQREYKEWTKTSQRERDEFDRYRHDRSGRGSAFYAYRRGFPASRGGVCFYMDSNFRGESYCLDLNDRQRYVGKRFNDRISSIRLFGGVHRVVVYEHDDYGGSWRIITGDIPSLGNFNDRISSVEVR